MADFGRSRVPGGGRRARPLPSLAAGMLLVAAQLGCGEGPCEPMGDCVRTERVDGSCTCAEWRVVTRDPAPLEYVVAAVVYALAGNQSGVQYGGGGSEPFLARSYSPVGSRLRAQVRPAAGGPERLATVGAAEAGAGWALDRVTPATVALTAPPEAMRFMSSVDIPSHAVDDLVLVWVNPSVTVVTDAAGGKAVEWGTSDAFPECGYGSSIRIAHLTPAMLLGTQPVLDPCAAAFLGSLDAAQRAELVAYDVFFRPVGALPQDVFDSPQTETIENVTVSYDRQRTGAVSWSCIGSLRDDADVPLARSEIQTAGGETLAIEHVLFSTDAACPDRTVGCVIRTGTPQCELPVAFVLDLAFGTVLMTAEASWPYWDASPCTR